MFGTVDSSLYEMGLRVSSDPFAGCIDLMQHSSIRVYTRLQELRIIKFLLDSNGPPMTSLASLVEQNSYSNTNAL